jgi:hypothetical protein
MIALMRDGILEAEVILIEMWECLFFTKETGRTLSLQWQTRDA